MGTLVLKFIIWAIVISALIELAKLAIKLPVVAAQWVSGRIYYAKLDRKHRAESAVKMRDYYTYQAIFVSIVTGEVTAYRAQQIAISKAEGVAVHSKRVNEAMNQSGRHLTAQQLASLGL